MLRLHHVNFSVQDVVGLTEWYLQALSLTPLPLPNLQTGVRHLDVSFLNAGDPEELQLHIASQQVELGRTVGHFVNPVERGHIAFRCDDINEVKERLDRARVPYSDYGRWAIPNWHQIYFRDPVGTVIEVHQVIDDA